MPFIGKQSTSNSQITNYTTTVGSGGQTNFTVVVEGGDETHVYLNGVLLKETTDYTVSSTQVSLVSPAVENDIVEIKVFRSFALVDAVKATGGTFSGDVAYTGNIQVDDIVEKTSAHGVEIDGVTLKDGGGTFTGSIGIGTSPNKTLDIDGQARIRNGGSTGYGLLEYGTSSTATNNWHVGSEGDGTFRFYNGNFGAGTERLRIDSSGNVGIGVGASSPDQTLVVKTADGGGIAIENSTGDQYRWAVNGDNSFALIDSGTAERLRIDSSGNVLVGTTTQNPADNNDASGAQISQQGTIQASASASTPAILNRGGDGTIMAILRAGVAEGSISVSGTTVSYNGGHLSRWSRLTDDSKDTSIVKGTVMTNLDEMVVWSHDAVEAKDAVYDEDGNVITEAVEAKEAYTEENEQLNKMAISSVEGDPNVAGVFVNWDEDDDFNDMNIAMTGDMVIRIAQGVTVEKGQLLMSAGDGTAKPQGDDIVKNKTIAKVTSNHVSHTYDDGSYCVPCVLMAC